MGADSEGVKSFSHYPPPLPSPPLPSPPLLPPSPSFSGSTTVLAFAQLYLLLFEPLKKKHQHQETTKIVVGKVRLDKSLPSG